MGREFRCFQASFSTEEFQLAQELMRHSDVNLTMGIYSHIDLPDMAAAVERLPSHHKPASEQPREPGTDSLVAGLVAVKPGDIGDSQVLSQRTDDQAGLSSPEQEERQKAQRGQQVTTIRSAHKKEPPLGLEPRTYALRKRRRDDASTDDETTCADSDPEFALEFASVTSGDDSEQVRIPEDLVEVIRLWPALDDAVRVAVRTMVTAAAGTPQLTGHPVNAPSERSEGAE